MSAAYVSGNPRNRRGTAKPFFEGWRREKGLQMLRAGWWQQDIAREMGCAGRTVQRWLARDPEAREAWETTQRWAHGLSGYTGHGCRCDTCQKANTDRCRRWKAGKRPEDAPVHGVASTYRNYGCRCKPCTAAATRYNAPYHRAWRERKRQPA
jgi:hypothetical protein